MTDPAGHPSDYLPELALGVLGGAEAEALRAHLAGCSACQEEFAELERVAALLPLAAQGPGPAPWAREELLRRARAERPHITRPAVVPRLALQFAAGLLLLASGALLGWLLARPGGPDGRDLAARDALVTAAARGEAIRAEASSPAGIRASLLLAPSAGAAAAVLEGLPPAPAGRTYQGWLLEGATARPAGLLPGDGTLLLLPGGDLRRFTAFALTLEPAGGAPAPTSDPLVVVPFALAASR